MSVKWKCKKHCMGNVLMAAGILILTYAGWRIFESSWGCAIQLGSPTQLTNRESSEWRIPVTLVNCRFSKVYLVGSAIC